MLKTKPWQLTMERTGHLITLFSLNVSYMRTSGNGLMARRIIHKVLCLKADTDSMLNFYQNIPQAHKCIGYMNCMQPRLPTCSCLARDNALRILWGWANNTFGTVCSVCLMLPSRTSPFQHERKVPLQTAASQGRKYEVYNSNQDSNSYCHNFERLFSLFVLLNKAKGRPGNRHSCSEYRGRIWGQGTVAGDASRMGQPSVQLIRHFLYN